MKKLVFVSVFSLSIVSSAFAQSSAKISGTITLAGADSVLHEVSVQIVELKRVTQTDTNGRYEFGGLPPGRYTLRTHQAGFAEATKTIVLVANAAAVVDFQLQLAGLNEQVTVTASGTEISTFESIASVNTVSSSQIAQRASVGLGEVLDNEAGVAKRSSTAASRPVIRGFDGDRVKVAADGIGVGSLASQSGDHSEPVDTLAVERIEVVKGPATLLYGSSAIGGVVNVISGHDEGAHPGFRGYFSTIGGVNNNQAAANGGIDLGTRRWMFWANGGGQRTGDYKAGGNFGRVQNSFTRSTSGSLGLGYFASKAFLSANYSYYTNNYGVPLAPADPERRELRVWRGNLKSTFGYNDPAWAITGIKFTVDLSNYRHQELADEIVGTTFRNAVNSVRAMFEQKKKGRLSGRFGFEGYRRNFSTIGDEVLVNGPVKQNAFSVFGLEELTFERFTLQFGGRIERNAYDPADPALLKRTFTGFSGAVGAKFNIWKGGVFVANYAHGYRAAALDELYNNGAHDGSLLFEVGNANLRPEKNNGIDLSLRHQNSRVKAEANFYYYAFKDFVFLAPTNTFDPDSGFEIARFLQGDSRFTGTELSIDLTTGKYLNVFTAFDYVNAQLDDGRPLPRIPPMRFRTGLDFHYNRFVVRPEFVAVGRQDRIFTNETPTAGYGTVNVIASYIQTTKHTANIFSVNAYNLNNKLYFNHISFIKDLSPEIGRGVRFTYTIRFF
ncbi:MAG: TonB-dependent receptor [Pyrinomonadaceae bacterium]